MERIARWGGPAAVAGGLLWLLVWAHGLAAHGPTQVNRKEVVIGLTWMDSAKALVVCFLLFGVAAVALFAWIERPRLLGTTAIVLTLLGLGLLALGTALHSGRFRGARMRTRRPGSTPVCRGGAEPSRRWVAPSTRQERSRSP